MGTRVGVVGATGRLGTAVCAAVEADPELELVAAVARSGGTTAHGLAISPRIDALAEANVEVVVDVSRAEATREVVRWCAENGVHVIVGTTGLTDDDIEAWSKMFTRSNGLVAPNFSVGAVLSMRFAELAAPHFETAEVIELHREGKADVPVGHGDADGQAHGRGLG